MSENKEMVTKGPKSVTVSAEIETKDAEKPKKKHHPFWWGLLAFLVPIVGIILGIKWWDTDKRDDAKGMLIGAGIILSLPLQVQAIYFMITAIMPQALL